MSIFTLEEIAEQKALWKEALRACSVNQAVVVEGRQFTRADLPEIRRTLEWLNEEERKVTSAGPLFASFVPPRFP